MAARDKYLCNRRRYSITIARHRHHLQADVVWLDDWWLDSIMIARIEVDPQENTIDIVRRNNLLVDYVIFLNRHLGRTREASSEEDAKIQDILIRF